jgi:methyl-accepting chemotaxis protein
VTSKTHRPENGQSSRDRSGPLTSRAGRIGDGDQESFRWQIRVGAAALLVVNVAVGLFVYQQQHAIIDYAVNVYDTAFVSTNYLHLAQVSFQHYVDDRLRAATPEEKTKTGEGLENVLNNLDVVIERADSPRSRTLAKEVRARISALVGDETGSAELRSRLNGLQEDIERLASRASAVGLKARDDIEGFSAKSDVLLSLSIFTSIAMIIVALLLLERMISQAQAVRRDTERRDAELAAAAEQRRTLREKELAAKAAQADHITKLLDGFMQEMTEPTEQLHGAAKDLNLNADGLNEMAQQANAQSGMVAAASEETAAMVQSAAMAGDELARTIAAVEAHAIESSRLAAGAVDEVLQTNSTIDELAVVANEISDVTDLINKIAGQTNLLALNATIEAARAGEAGRGFAIVAQEVKALAGQTANATRNINQRIGAIQSVTVRSVGAIQGISSTIRELNRFSVSIASAVEQQTRATHKIAKSLTAASASVVNVNEAITQIESVGSRTAKAAGMLTSASVSVTKQAKTIHEQVIEFTEGIREIQAKSDA